MMAVKNIAIKAICSWKIKRTDKFHMNLPEVLQVTTDHCYPHLNFSLPKLSRPEFKKNFFPPPIRGTFSGPCELCANIYNLQKQIKQQQQS